MNNTFTQIGKYADIRLDRWFKRTFGVEARKHLLVELLKRLIPEHDFADIHFAQQEFTNANPDLKSIRVDISARDSDGTRVILEMQMVEQHNYYERIAFNSSFPVMEQKDRGSMDNDFPSVYMLNFMNFSYHKGSDQVLYRGRFRWDDTNEAITDRVQLIFLELPNCTKALTPEATFADNFSYVLRNIGRMTGIPPELEDDEFFRDLFKSAEIATFTADENEKYRKDMLDQESIYMNQRFYEEKGLEKGFELGREEGLEIGREEGLSKGLARGREEGREEGREKEKLEMARSLKELGVENSIICQASGLTAEEVEAL